jgi:diguanylate cyclase (GGDEF)-like protein
VRLPSSKPLLTRATFLAALEQMLQTKPNPSTGSALLLLRVDRFGGLSAALGYKKVDTVLEKLATHLASLLQPSDLLAVYNLGSFLVWLPNIVQRVDALQTAHRLGRAIEIDVNGHAVPLSFSVAFVLWPDQGNSVEALLRAGHQALWQAKATGGNHVCLANSPLDEPAAGANDWSMQNTLKRAIASSSLALHYQPVVDLTTGKWIAVEALLRPRIRELAGVSTDSIMGIAETLPVLGELTRWGLIEACMAAAQWHKQTQRWLPVSVNLPGAVLASSGLVYWLRQALEQSGMPGAMLTLELTERSFVDSDALTQMRLNEIRALSCVLAIDDFGVGQAALAQLIRLPVTSVKFDRSLISDLGVNPKACIMLKHLLDMMHELGLQAVAEGVETAEQETILRELGCQSAQGYYFSVPLTAVAIERMLLGDV